MKKLTLAAMFIAGSVSMSLAGEYDAVMKDYLEKNISSWMSDPVILAALKTQNAETAVYDQDQINNMDLDWRAQVGTSNSPLVDQVISNPAADYLREQVNASGGAITEVFIMDAQGLNVAASAPTSDMWQGDEAKYQETYLIGPNATHFSDIEFDESSQTYQGQISISVTDPETGDVVGAITVGVDAEALL